MKTLSLIALLLVTLLCAPASRAQGPEGNTHPQTKMLARAGATNPFGPPARETVNVDAKYDFSRRLDLTPLKDLAVFDRGRVKILNTLARETVAQMCARKNYLDFRPRKTGQGGETLAYDPLFTFLDMTIDPSYYEMRPLISVDYLPVRRAFLDKIYADPQMASVLDTAAKRESYMRIGRLPPALIARYYGDVSSTDSTVEFQRALAQVHEGVMLYSLTGQTYLMIPPADFEKPWEHLSSVAAGTPLMTVIERLGTSWRAGDAAGVNSAVRDLAGALPALSPAVYPTTRRTIESAYNSVNPFEFGFWFYAVALVSLLLAFGTQRPWLKWTGIGFLALAASVHLFGFAARCYVAERFAIQNQFESMTGVSLFAAIVGLGLAIFKRQLIFGAAVAAVGFLVLITATKTGIPGSSIGREAAILNTSVLLKYHVTIVLLSYGLISLGFVISIFYLASHYLGRRAAQPAPALAAVALPGGGMMRVATADIDAVATAAVGLGGEGGAVSAKARLLSDLDGALMTVLQLAFWALGVGILLGAWWADHSWGRWWAFDPKELWALVTWLVYLVVVHLRFAQIKDKGLVTAWLSVLGFIVMLWCYFGVNLLLPGLHAYA
ncbi:MAG: cytochrome c biogenesis protein [Phycisphaerales bacterium]